MSQPDHHKTILVGAAAITAAVFFAFRHYSINEKKSKEDVGLPYNVAHAGHVGQSHVGELLKTLEGKEGKNEFVLTYFDSRGRGEALRLVFHDTRTPFRDATPENWPQQKKAGLSDGTIPFGHLPHLRHGQFHLVESNAILRYLGRKLDRYGTSDEEHAKVDMLIDAIGGLREAYMKLIYESKLAEEPKEAYLQTLRTELQYFENVLERNKGGQLYFVGDSFTIADINFWEFLDQNLRIAPGLFDALPLLKGFYARVAARPALAAYLKSPARRQKCNGNNLG